MSTVKRSVERAKKRLMVRYGVDKMDCTGFTKNVSESGLHIQTNKVIRPGAVIRLELKFPDQSFNLWGSVVWARKVPSQLAHAVACGMGIRFLESGPEWSEYCRAHGLNS